jgi:sulfatase modifying factor 1
MASSDDDTILPPRRPVNLGSLDGDTVLPQQNAAGIHVPGDVIDNRYTVIREIGRGGMGVVYEVEDQITMGRYAIKGLLPESTSDEQIVRAFVREGTLAEQFSTSSNYFVTTKFVGKDTSGFYSVMELINSPTLRQLLKPAGYVEPVLALPILLQFAAALSTLHNSDLIHRDLKPENVFVDTELGNPSVKLVDFGLTREVSSITITGLGGAGSLHYMAPEQLRGEPATQASDVYAFGVIAFELLTGELPGVGDVMSDYRTNIDNELSVLVMDCLSKHRERRPLNGQAVFAKLEQISSKSLIATSSIDKSPINVDPPQSLLTTITFRDLQNGAIVLVDGTPISVGNIYRFDVTVGTKKALNISVKWEGFEVFRGSEVLSAGEHRILVIPKAFQIKCDVPDWCCVKDETDKVVSFPLFGLVSNRSGLRSFSLFHNDVKFGSMTAACNAGSSTVVILYQLSSLTLKNTQALGTFRITGAINQLVDSKTMTSGPFVIPIQSGKFEEIKVTKVMSNGTDIIVETIVLKSGENISIRMADTVGRLPEQSERKDGDSGREESGNTDIANGPNDRISRKVLLGGGLATIAVAGSTMFLMSPRSETSKLSVDEANLHDSLLVASDRCRLHFPELSRYLRSMRIIRHGKFMQGSPSTVKNVTGQSDEIPAHSVRLSGFGLGETPVTVALWKEYCKATNVSLPEAPGWGWLDDHPIVNVSWIDIMGTSGTGGFCHWASKATGIRFSLPTEAQFEYACRGGKDNLQFPWGNDYDQTKLWCSSPRKRMQTAPVNRTKWIYRNDFGLTDMVGNVWQWCLDLFSPYTLAEQTNPIGPSKSEEKRRIQRGGCWTSDRLFVFKCSDRLSADPNNKYSGCGFRLAAINGKHTIEPNQATYP